MNLQRYTTKKRAKWKHVIFVHSQIPMQDMRMRCVGTVVGLVFNTEELKMQKQPEIIHLCRDCIADLKKYNPYVVPVKIVEVNIAKCDNYTIDGEFVNAN